MTYLFLASLGLVLYGTLYPFTFVADAHSGGLLAAFANSMFVRPGRGDILSNIVLFLPFGFFGMQALPRRMPKLLRYALVFGLGIATSLAIECAQYYTPTRTTSLYDLALNSISALVGAAAGRFNWQGLVAGGTDGVRPRSIFPLFLIAAWLGFRLFPYVPTIDLQHVKDALKPLLSIGSADPIDVLRHFAAFLVLGRLLQAVTTPLRANLILFVFGFGVIAAKPFIMTKIISPAEVFGAIAGAVVWFAALGRMNSRTMIITIVFVASIAIQGVIPFELRADTGHFSFVPFSGFESGSMAANLQAFLEKVFLYGALIWMVGQTGASTEFSLVFNLVFLAAIEVAQTFIIDRSAEITDPLLGVVMGVILITLERHYRMSAHDDRDLGEVNAPALAGPR